MAKNPFSNTTNTSKKNTTAGRDDIFSKMSKLASQNLNGSSGTKTTASKPNYQSKVEMPTMPTVSTSVGNHLSDYGQFSGSQPTTPTVDTAKRKQEIEARLKQIQTEYSTTATVLSGYQRGGMKQSNAYAIAQAKADELLAERGALEKELQALREQAIADGEVRDATLKDYTVNAFKQGYYNSRLGEESYDAMMGNENEQQKYADILAGEDYQFAGGNAFEEAMAGAAQLLGQQARQFTNLRTLGSAAAGGIAGFGIGTVMGGGLGSVITAPAAAIKGTAAGFTAGSAVSNFEIEAGLAYNEMIENGVTPETAKKVALAVGGVNAGLELVQLDELTKSFKILKNNPATEGVADSLGKRLIDMGVDVSKSVGKETLQEVAQEGSTIAGVQAATKKDTGEWAYNTGEVVDRLADTAKSSALSFGVMNVPHIAVGTHNAVRTDRVGSNYNVDIDALIDEGLQSDQNSESYKKASQLRERLDNGGKVSNVEAYDLAVANQQAIDTENKLAVANRSVQTVESPVETAPVQSRVQTIQTRLAESGMETARAESVATSVDRILKGDTTVTNKDKDVLSVGNAAARAIFEEETGIKLPASNSSTRKAVSEYIAQTALKQQKATTEESSATVSKNETVVNQTPVNVMSTEAINQLKNSVAMPTATANTAEATLRQAAEIAVSRAKTDNAITVQSDMTSLGTHGKATYQKHLGNAKSITGYSNAFQRYYDAGQIGLPFESIKTAYDGAVDRSVLFEAYSAGQNDASGEDMGKPTLKNKNAQKGKKMPSKGKGKFYDSRTSEGKAVDEKTTAVLKQFAKVFNVDIELVDTIPDSKGRSIANGYYANGKVVLAADSDNPLMTVLKHEVTHHLQKTSPKQYKAFKDYVMKAYYENSQEVMNAEIQRRIDLAALNNLKLTRAEAMDEIVADATESFLTDRDSIDALVRENRSLAETILNAIRDVLRKIEAAMKGESLKGYSDFMNTDQLKQAEKMWVEALAAAADGREVGVNFAEITESSAPVWSLKSMKFDLLDGQMQRDLVTHGIMTAEESQNLMDQISKLIDEMSPFAHIVDMNEEYSKGNRPFNVYKPNSDPLYKVSLDFSTLCKKRLMTQFVMESLQTKLGKALSAKEQLAIRSKLEEYGKTNQQIQVACALCYVEARRLNAPDQINRFLDDRTTILTNYFGKKNKEYKASVDAMADRMKVEMGHKADTKLKDLKPAEKKKINTAKQKMMKEYIPSAEEQKIIERANAIDNKEFLSQAGLTNLSLNDPVIYDAFVSHVRNATKSKALESGVPYYYGDSKSVSDSLIESMNAENGLRHQSWSDFEIVHLLDNIAAVIELSVRKAKMQAYTKVPDFVHVNGNTGMMINLSLIPAGKTGIKDGKLDFSPTEGMDYEVAVGNGDTIGLRDQYHKTVGTIAIGIDDKQIQMMLDDETIDYVIPYHTSGMNAQLRKMAGISGWLDYESFQSEKEIKGAKQGDCPDELWHKKPDFSEWFDTSKLDMSKSGVEIMREAAGRYLVMCEERGLHPKFSNTKQHTDFSKHDNYWKLLIDRKMVDGDGNIIVQQAVRPDFDFGKISEIVKTEVKNYDPTLLDSINEMISNEWESGGIKQREKELLVEEKKAKKAKKTAAKVANGLLEQVVAPEGAQFSMKLGKQEYRQVQSARMSKYAGMDEANIPRIDYVYARDQFYVVENFALDGFGVKSKIDPEKKSDLINFLMGVIDNGDLENFTGDSKSLETLWGNERRRIRDLRDRNGRGKGRGTSGLAAGSRESSEGKSRSGGGRETGGSGLKQYSLKDSDYMDAVKRGDMETAQKMVAAAARENGYTPVKRYHQTAGGFTRFSTANPRAALNDSETPNGIFFKDNDHDIGLEGKVQLHAYLKADNMLHFRNREDANSWYCANVDGYAPLEDEYNAAMKPFLDELDEIEKKMFDKDTTEDEYDALDEKEEQIIEEMKEVEDSYRGQLRELLNNHFLNGTSGYDGIELDYDGHRWVNGKRENVHTYIVFDPAQAKSADPVTYDDNGNVIPLSERFNAENDDIRYSMKDSAGNTLTEAQAEYFKDSKVRDEDGNLKAVYHGTPTGGFTEFKLPEFLSSLMSAQGAGFYFTDEANARQYMKPVNKTVSGNKQLYEVYLNITNPLTISENSPVSITKDQVKEIARRGNYEWFKTSGMAHQAGGDRAANKSLPFEELLDKWADKVVRTAYYDSDILSELTRAYRGDGEILEAMQDVLGYDGVRYTDRYGDIWVAWNANQIKNTTNKNPTFEPDIRYQLKTPDEMLEVAEQLRHEAKAVTDADIMSQAIKDIAKTDAEKKIVGDYQRAMKNLADYEKQLAVYEATKAEHSKGRSIYTDASGKVKKSGVKYSAAEKAEIQQRVNWWKNRLKEIEQKAEFQKILKREKAEMAKTHAKKMAKLRDVYDQRLRDVRAKRDEKIEAEKQKMRDYKQHQRDSKEYKALKGKLEADVKWLDERLRHPTDAKHIPEEFKKGVAAFLDSLDFTSPWTDRYEVVNGVPSQKKINLTAMKDAYEKILKDQSSTMELDEIQLEALRELEKICANKRVADLDYAELGLVRDAIQYIKMSVAVADKAFNAEIKESISAMGEALIQEQRSKKAKKDRAGILGEGDKLINYDNVAPADKFHEFGGVMEKLYHEIRKGFDKHISNVQSAIDYTQKLTSGSEAAIKAWSGDKAKTTQFQISDGTTIELTPAQVMSLYCLMKREQAVGHVLGSGIVPSGVVVKEAKKFGKVKINMAKTVSAERASRCTIEDIQKIVDTMTDDQKKIADGVVKLFTTKCADWGNETSMKLYGYKKFLEPNYFPIRSSDAYLNARFDDSGDVLIKNLGFTKNTVVNANNPIVVEDIFDVLADHVNKMSMYNALVVPLTDFTRVFNYNSKGINQDGEVVVYDSVKKALEASGGTLGIQYIKQFMKDINKQANSLAAESFINQSISRYKKAKIAASARVLLQQPTSITRAAAMVDPKYLIKGLQQKANYEEMFNYSEIAYWKSLGFYQTDMGRNMKDILLDNESVLDRMTMGMYGKADDFAWGHLWNAIKLEQADAHPGMDTTSAEFMDLVKDRFDEVVDRTQVVDSVFHRSQMMRAPGAATKVAAAFMSEPTKAFNLLRTDLIDSINSKDYSKFKRSVVTYVANAVLVSAFAGVADMIRDDEDEDDEGNKRSLWDKYRDAVSGNIVDNINPLGMIPYLKEINSMLQGYDINRMEMASLAEFVKTARKWTQGKYSLPYLAKETAEDLSELFGIPLKNAVRDVTALVRTAGDMAGGHYYADYMVDKMKYSITNSDNRSVFYKHYMDALLGGDEKAAAMILEDMVINGIPYDNIVSRGYQKQKEAAFSEARKLIAAGKDDEARDLIRDLAKKYDKKYTTLWKAVKGGDSADTPEETYDFKDLQKAVRKGEDTELIEEYLTEYGGYSEEALEEAVKMLTEKYK